MRRRPDVTDDTSTAFRLKQSLDGREKSGIVDAIGPEEPRVLSFPGYSRERGEERRRVFYLDNPGNLPKNKRHTRQEGQANISGDG